jgi:hypothetical protein
MRIQNQPKEEKVKAKIVSEKHLKKLNILNISYFKP